jgi:hypothetical protein
MRMASKDDKCAKPALAKEKCCQRKSTSLKSPSGGKMGLFYLLSTSSSLVVLGCASQSNRQIPVTVLPSHLTNTNQSTTQSQLLTGDFFADELAAKQISASLWAVPECREYMDIVYKRIGARSTDCDSISSPHDTMITAKFDLHQDGTISDVAITRNTNAPVAPCMVQAIKNCSPFPRWSEKMRSIVGQDYFIIYYPFGFNVTPPPPG